MIRPPPRSPLFPYTTSSDLRLVPLLRGATADPGRPAGRPPARERRTARRDARGTAAHHRIPAPRSSHDGPDHLESRGPGSLRDLRARAGALRARRRAAAQHAGARAGPFGAARFSLARGSQPDRALLLLPAAQPVGAPGARDDG